MVVLRPVSNQHDSNTKVEYGFDRLILAKVVFNVLTKRGGGLLGSRCWANRQLLIESDKLGHSLGIGVTTKTLKVTISSEEVEYLLWRFYACEV